MVLLFDVWLISSRDFLVAIENGIFTIKIAGEERHIDVGWVLIKSKSKLIAIPRYFNQIETFLCHSPLLRSGRFVILWLRTGMASGLWKVMF